MAQHDMNIANQGFPATRADLNNALQALASNNSGTSAPSTTFANQWWYDTTNNKLYIRNEANNAWIQVAVLDQTNAEWQITTGVIQAKDGDGILLKTDEGTTRVTLDDSGNLLVGQASQDTAETGFSARANSLSHFCRDTSSTGSGVLLLNKKSGSGDVLVVQKDGTTFGTIGVVNANNMYLSGSASNHAGVQFGTQNVTPYNNGSESNGAVDLGASNLRWKDLYLSGGAYLGGTGAANKLDDYEEGTWTPAVVGGTQTASVVSAHYTKIGRLVTLNVYIQLSNVTNSTYLIIGGLPFTVDGYTATNIVNAQYNDTDRTPLIRSQSNSTNAEVIYATGNQLGVTQTNLNGNFIFTLTYEQQ